MFLIPEKAFLESLKKDDDFSFLFPEEYQFLKEQNRLMQIQNKVYKFFLLLIHQSFLGSSSQTIRKR